MIDPTKITKYDRTQEELEELWIFCVCVAGKHALRTARAVDALLNDGRFLSLEERSLSPLQRVGALIGRGSLTEAMRAHGLGQYTRVESVLATTIENGVDLSTVSVRELESIRGVGPKTARFFVLHSREGERVAVLDTHLLRFLKEMGHEVPASLSGKRYLELEQELLHIADERGEDPADFDLAIWREYSGHRTL